MKKGIKRKIYNLNSELYKVTGIQRVLLDIHDALKTGLETKIVGTIPYRKVNRALDIDRKDYVRLLNPFMFRNSVVVIHERRLLPLMWVLTHIPGLNIRCVYVHHNELYGNKKLSRSLFPKNIVAISDAGIRNLTGYFGVSEKKITKIHNCVRETGHVKASSGYFNPDDIKILYPARINSVKQQVEIVKNLQGRLDSRIKILFAGIGPMYDELKSLCSDSGQFQALGFRNDIPELMCKCDFMMLFSQHEGLPISLIEATQSGTPIICNDVGGNIEIVRDGENGFVVNDWDSLLSTLNSLPLIRSADIARMSEAGRNIYLNNFNFDIFKRNYSQLIKSIK